MSDEVKKNRGRPRYQQNDVSVHFAERIQKELKSGEISKHYLITKVGLENWQIERLLGEQRGGPDFLYKLVTHYCPDIESGVRQYWLSRIVENFVDWSPPPSALASDVGSQADPIVTTSAGAFRFFRWIKDQKPGTHWEFRERLTGSRERWPAVVVIPTRRFLGWWKDVVSTWATRVLLISLLTTIPFGVVYNHFVCSPSQSTTDDSSIIGPNRKNVSVSSSDRIGNGIEPSIHSIPPDESMSAEGQNIRIEPNPVDVYVSFSAEEGSWESTGGEWSISGGARFHQLRMTKVGRSSFQSPHLYQACPDGRHCRIFYVDRRRARTSLCRNECTKNTYLFDVRGLLPGEYQGVVHLHHPSNPKATTLLSVRINFEVCSEVSDLHGFLGCMIDHGFVLAGIRYTLTRMSVMEDPMAAFDRFHVLVNVLLNKGGCRQGDGGLTDNADCLADKYGDCSLFLVLDGGSSLFYSNAALRFVFENETYSKMEYDLDHTIVKEYTKLAKELDSRNQGRCFKLRPSKYPFGNVGYFKKSVMIPTDRGTN